MKKILIGILTLSIILTTFTACSLPFSKKDNEEVNTEDEKLTEEDSNSVCELEVIPEDNEEKLDELEEEVEFLDDDGNLDKDEKEDDKKDEKTEDEKPKETKAKPLPYRIEVDVTNQVVTVYGRDSNGKYTNVVRQMICTTGTSSTPTPLGTFKMPGQKGRWGYFTKFDVYAQYWNRIKGSILFHSVLFKTQDVSTISMTSVNNLGRPASHGCVRLTVADAKWLYENIPAGTEVEVLKKKKNAGLTQKLKAEMPAHSVVRLALDTPASIPIGATQQKELVLNATYDNGKIKNVAKEAKWSVENPQIATVQGGMLTGLKEGTTSFTATFGGMSTKGTIVVGPAPAPEPPKPNPTLIVSPANITLEIQEVKGVKLVYNDGQEQVVSDQAKWRTVNENIAVVDRGNIKGISAGETEIIAEFKGLTAKVKVVVNKKPEEPKPEEPKPEEPKPEEPKVKDLIITPSGELKMAIGEEKKLDITVIMTDGTEVINPSDAKWLSGNPDIVSVVGGVIKGVSKGTTQVSISYNGLERSIDISIE